MDPVDQILDVGRRTRKKPSRAMWIVAAIIGGLCVVGFLAMFVFGGDAAAPSAKPTATPSDGGLGFSTGLVIGLAVGAVLGVLIARQLRSSHSSSNNP